MSTYTINKVSGVISVLSSDLTYPKYYFGAKGTFQPATDGSSILITIIDSDKIADQLTVSIGSLTVGTSTPSTLSSCVVLLNSIFGT